MSTNDDNALYFDVQQKTDKQHILDNPDTYIGSVETVDAEPDVHHGSVSIHGQKPNILRILPPVSGVLTIW